MGPLTIVHFRVIGRVLNVKTICLIDFVSLLLRFLITIPVSGPKSNACLTLDYNQEQTESQQFVNEDKEMFRFYR